MEYYIYTTKHCNLACRYCDGIGLTKLAQVDGSGPDIGRVAEFIARDLRERKCERASIVFYGGEPLLNQDCMIQFINSYRGRPVEYVLHTNGILLDHINTKLLGNLAYIFVSVDGYEEQHDTNRGRGTYARIMGSVRRLRQIYSGELIARITLYPGYSLVKSILGVMKDFDHVFWQLENSADVFEGMDACASNYIEELRQLADLWKRWLVTTMPATIIPFQAILRSLLLGEKHQTLRCGASGESLLYIDIDGQVSVCDKMLGKEEFCVGNIRDGVRCNTKYVHTLMRDECYSCSHKYICGGRCLAQLVSYPKDKFDFYCKCTRMLINVISDIVPYVKPILDDNMEMKAMILSDKVLALTEQIP